MHQTNRYDKKTEHTWTNVVSSVIALIASRKEMQLIELQLATRTI